MANEQALAEFETTTAEWVAANFPSTLAGSAMGLEGETDESTKADFELWRQRLADKGWGAPTWPVEFGGAGLSHPEAKSLVMRWPRWALLIPFRCWRVWA